MKIMNPPYPSSVYIITPISRKARDWVKRNVALEPWQWQGAGFVLDFHSAPIIVRAMLDQGMEDGKDFEVASANPRPPARWWAYMWPRIAAGYPRRRGESLKRYREAINRIVGGIWWGYPEKTRAHLIRKFENPVGRDYPRPWMIPGAASMNPRRNPFLDDLATGLALGGGWSIAAAGIGHVAKALKRKKGEKKEKA